MNDLTNVGIVLVTAITFLSRLSASHEPTGEVQETTHSKRTTARSERTLSATQGEWRAVTNISKDDGISMMPALEVDGAGNVHLAWMGKSEGRFDIFYSRWTANDDWLRPRNVSNSTSPSMFPTLDVDKSGTVNLAWMEGHSDSFDIYFSLGSGAKWSRPMNISENKGISQRPKLVLDSSGIVHAIWYDNTSGSPLRTDQVRAVCTVAKVFHRCDRRG